MLLTDRDLLLLGSWLRPYFEATTTNTPSAPLPRTRIHSYIHTRTHARTYRNPQHLFCPIRRMRLTSACTARRRGTSTFTDQGLDRNGQVGWLTGWLASSAGRKRRNRLYVCVCVCVRVELKTPGLPHRRTLTFPKRSTVHHNTRQHE